MVFAYMSRRSVRRALLKGISAEQLVSFLTQHCHPQMYKQNPVVPRTISDQASVLFLSSLFFSLCVCVHFSVFLFPYLYLFIFFILSLCILLFDSAIFYSFIQIGKLHIFHVLV